MDIRSFCLDTEGFAIRLLADNDQPLFCQLFTDESAMAHIGPALSEQDAAALFESAVRANQRQPNRDLFWTIRCTCNRNEIGICALQRIDWRSGVAEIGMMLLPTQWHRGVGYEVLGELVRTSFERFGLKCLKASYHADNIAARHLFAARGFAPMRKPSRKAAVEIASLTDEVWQASKAHPNGSLSIG